MAETIQKHGGSNPPCFSFSIYLRISETNDAKQITAKLNDAKQMTTKFNDSEA